MENTTKIKVSGCIVSYNNAKEIGECIESLLEQTKGVELKLYVSDNGSADDTLEIVRRWPQVRILANGENKGFGAGHNKVLPLLDSRYHVIINPDIRLQEDAISEMAAYMEAHPEVGLMQPDVLNLDGTRQELPKRIPTWRYLLGGRLSKKIRAEYCRTGEQLSVPTEIDFCTGCFMFIRTDCFKAVGGFDERYFLYIEDADLGRMVQKTHKVLFYPEARVYHAWQRADKGNLRLTRIHFQSAFRYFRKWRREKRA